MSNYKSKFLTNCELDESILHNWGCNTLKYFIEKHNVPGRYYHTFNHIDEVIFEIEEFSDSITDEETKILIIAALYHDIVYDPSRGDNEEESVKLFADNVSGRLDAETIATVCRIIRYTTYQRNPKDDLEHVFACCDLAIFEKDFTTQLKFEKQIQKEFAWVPLETYVPERIKILDKLRGLYYGHEENRLCSTHKLIHYLENKKWNVGVYAGSFYPFHRGHYDVFLQAEKMFDKVIILQSPELRIKQKTNFEWEQEKYGRLNPIFDNYETHVIRGLITDNLRHFQLDGNVDVTLIRGLRNGSDLLYEQNYIQTLRDIDPEISVVHLLTNPENAHVSSSMIRELLKTKPKFAEKYYILNKQ